MYKFFNDACKNFLGWKNWFKNFSTTNSLSEIASSLASTLNMSFLFIRDSFSKRNEKCIGKLTKNGKLCPNRSFHEIEFRFLAITPKTIVLCA